MKSMKTIQGFVLALLLSSGVVLLTGCEGAGTQGKGLMSSSGRSGEMLVVCADTYWKGLLGDSLQAVFMSSLEFLPQNEPMFTLSQVNHQRFNAIYQKQRNILYIDISEKHNVARVSVMKNKWASPQIIVSFSAKSEEEALQLLSLKKERIKELFMQSEMRRLQKAQKAQQDRSIDKKLQNYYKLSMIIPKGFVFAVRNEEFCWLRKETKYWGQSVLIYFQEYTDTAMLQQAHIIAYRNTLTKKYVFGSIDSTYVQVDEKYIPPGSEYFNFNGQYAVKTQGLWKTVGGDFMGGPFISFSILDEKRKRIVTVDGFLYAPTDDKRDLLRQVEAVLLSTKIID
ncbi:MAG: DUF4837 family protein [Bacteroidales bacterium]|jgi:hypothetical protein|nr:DUF4837 family protein [Bacteroidales bacterium]